MPKFKLTKDSKYTTWWRDFYEVEAASMEEAIQKVATNQVDAKIGSSEIDDTLEQMDPDQNDGMPTIEIFDHQDGVYDDPAWTNGLKITGS